MKSRQWLLAVGAAGLITALAHGSAAAQTIQKLRVQASFPPTSVAMDGFKLYSDRVRSMSAGRLDMEGLAAGTVVPAFEVLDAVRGRRLLGLRLLGWEASCRRSLRGHARRPLWDG
jgi:TRAP-type mannitol/chloroaromatic compound transport system substrate-binding protein